MPLDEWMRYLGNKGFDIPANPDPRYFDFDQPQRKEFYKVGGDSLEFGKIRTDLNLRSAFFSVRADSAAISLNGRGYGHGVGLSQEGGMEMAKQGKDFEDIILFYYPGVRIISFKELKKVQE